jgi:hypothetical protein
MKINTKLLVLSLFLISTQLSAQSLLHYWHFNTLNTGLTTPVNPATILPIKADFTTKDTSVVKLYYRAISGTSSSYTTYWDQTTGDLANARLGEIAGNCVRPRNPTDSMQLIMYIPSTGFQNITVKYGVQRSSASNGASENRFAYSVDSGATWRTSGLSATTFSTSTAWTTATVIINDTQANNNAKLVFRILFTGTGNTGTSGNNRIDNITVEGTTAGGGAAAPQVTALTVLDSMRLSVTYSTDLIDSSAINKQYYSLSPSIVVDSITYDSATRKATLKLASRFINGTSYIVTVNGVRSNSGGVMTNPYASNPQIFNDYAGQNLLITEINYNSPSGDPDTLDFVEIYNKGTQPINFGGLRFFNGLDNVLPSGTIPAQGFILIGMDSAKCRTFYNKPFIQFVDALGNGGEVLTLRNSLGTLLDSVNYDDAAPWPLGPPSPDGGGPSMELNSVTADNNVGSNWVVATSTTGLVNGIASFATPGALFAAPSIPAFSINSVSQNVAENIDSAIVIINIANSNNLPSSVKIRLINGGTASNGSDFNYTTQTINFAANSTLSQSIKIKINDDALAESAEYIFLQLDSAVNATANAGIIRHTIYIKDNDYVAPTPINDSLLTLLGSYKHNVSGSHSAEIVKFDSASKRLFIANSIGGFIDIVNFSNPLLPTPIRSVNIKSYGNINSIAVHNGLIAAAIENSVPENDGFVVFFDTAGTFIKQVTVGAMPDDISFTPDGKKVLTANEGQPNDAYTIDPEGSIGIVNLRNGITNLTQTDVRVARFRHFNNDSTTLRNKGVRIFGPKASVAQDMEPEYITYAADGRKAWVSLQENNALAVIDLITDSIVQILPLGYKDHMQAGNGLDASDQSGDVLIANWPIKGMYMPDALASMNVAGNDFILSANEGDARAYNGLDEEATVANLNLDSTKFPNAAFLKTNTALGRLTITNKSGDIDNDGDIDTVYVYGSRSFTIWNGTTGAKVFDSGDQLEQITAAHPVYGPIFNANNSTGTPAKKNRSDNKGPEPEGIVTATINDTVYAFIALERTGGVMVYDVTNPAAPRYVTYKNNRNITSGGIDLGSEGIIFISATQSPNKKPLVILANEISSTLSIYQLNTAEILPPPAAASLSGASRRVYENGGIVNETLSLSAPLIGAGQVVLKVNKGVNVTNGDFTTNPGLSANDSIVLSLPNGAINIGFSINIINDTLTENDESILFTIARLSPNMRLGLEPTFNLTILDDDTLTIGFNELLVNGKQIIMYPNPTNNGLVNFNEKVNAQVFDMQGKLMKEFVKQNQIDVSNLTKGIYFIKIENSVTKKLVIE